MRFKFQEGFLRKVRDQILRSFVVGRFLSGVEGTYGDDQTVELLTQFIGPYFLNIPGH